MDAPQRAIGATDSSSGTEADRRWIETVENHKLELAQGLIERAFDFDKSGQLDPLEISAARIVIYGQSLGGRGALRLCRSLSERNIAIRLAVIVDSFGRDPYTVPPNVAEAANLYQRDFGPIRGAPEIVAVDPPKTRILGNWRYTYGDRDIPMPGEPAIRRWFMRAHLAMEYDPEPWARVRGLVVAALSPQ